MADWLGFAFGLLAVGCVFGLLAYLLRRAQAGDPTKRGQDSSKPGGFYTDSFGDHAP
jgi:hypothetical protein